MVWLGRDQLREVEPEWKKRTWAEEKSSSWKTLLDEENGNAFFGRV